MWKHFLIVIYFYKIFSAVVINRKTGKKVINGIFKRACFPAKIFSECIKWKNCDFVGEMCSLIFLAEIALLLKECCFFFSRQRRCVW